MSDRNSEVIMVPSRHLGLIIGKGGATIKEISEETGCRVNISKDEAVNDEVPITLEGSDRNIEAAKNKINEITRRQHKRHQPDGDNRYGHYDNDRTSGDNKRQSRRDDDNGYFNNSNYGQNSHSNNSQNGYCRNNDDNYNSFSKGNSSNIDGDSWSRGRSVNADNDLWSRNNTNNSDNESWSRDNAKNNDKNSWSNGRSNNVRQAVNDDHWGGWGKTKDEDIVDSLIFKDGDSLRGTTKFLPQSVDNYVPEDDWGIPSYIEDDKPTRKRPTNAQQKMRATRDKNLYKIYRNFYVEHPNVKAMSVEEKDKFLKDKNNIMVKEIDTDKDSFCNFGGSLEEDPEDKIELIPVPKVVANPIRTFDEAFSRYPDILMEIKKQEFKEPSPIQCIGWPVLMSGRDLIGIAQTGTGKTLAFLLPAFIHIEGQIKPRENRIGPTVLILSPTRELAIQIQKEVQKYAYHDIDSVVCYGGADKREQINQLKENPEIVVGTPGRILDLKDSGILNLKDVSYLVLDEADRMLDMGFEIQVVNIIYSVRKQRQTVMTSATWPFSVQRIALNHMKDPVQVNVGTLDLNACHSVTQCVELVDHFDKTKRLVEILSEIAPDDKIIIFVARKAQCSDLAFELYLKRGKGELGPKGAVRACEIHGDLDQSERELALRMMRSGARNVMIATDVASRGLDIPDLTKVINFDFPKNIEEYVHRVGRTGRAGRSGLSITFMNRQDGGGAAELIKILQDADQEVPDFLPPLMKQYQEFRINGGRGKFGAPNRRGGGGYGRGGGGGRNSYGDRGSNSYVGGRRGDQGSDSFGRSNNCDDVKSDSSFMEFEESKVSNRNYSFDDSDDEDWGNWNKSSPKLKRIDKVVPEIKCDIKKESPKIISNENIAITDTKINLTPYILRNKDQNMYPICRNFYKEHPEVEKMNVEDVLLVLKQKNNIMIQELKTCPAQYNPNDNDDDHFDECKVEMLPPMVGIPKPVRTFREAFWEYPDILTIIEKLNFTEPSPIQCIGWPTLLGGRDFIGIAQTGTGKTLTFVLPALVHIEGQIKERKFRRGPTALILSPTRELAMQIESEILKIKYSDIKSVCCYGGADKASQIAGLRENPEIIVGTPGRIIDLMDMGYLCLKDVSYLVLDEADRMLDMGFEIQVVNIINCTRVQRQSVMTSATWPESVRMIALMYMDNPVQVNVGSLDLVACKDVIQELRQVENVKKTDVLCEILTSMKKNDKIIVFVTRKVQCRSLANMLDRMIRSDRLGPHANVCEIHGDLDQEARELSLSWFREGQCNILIATNVASRGLDISDVTYVVNYDFPNDIEEYVHRVGRTGRAGKQGIAITFMNDMDWKHTAELRNILNQSKQVVPPWLMHLRAMKPSNITNYDDCRIDDLKDRFSFNNDEDVGGSFFDHFQSKCDPTFRPRQSITMSKGKKKKTVFVEEKVVKYHSEVFDEVCDDLSDDYEDFFDEYQKEVDPTLKDIQECLEGTAADDQDFDSWW